MIKNPSPLFLLSRVFAVQKEENYDETPTKRNTNET